MNVSKKNKKDGMRIIPLLIVSIFLLLVSFGTTRAFSTNISGFAWGAYDSDGSGTYNSNLDGGIGWLSFNCADINVCATSEYGLIMDPFTGELSGYAWSSTIGWVTFNASEVVECPQGEGCTPRVNLGDGSVSGWARACSVFIDADGCHGLYKTDPELGGWDGWIEMSGMNHNSPDFSGNGGVTFDLVSGALIGYAWGGNSGGSNNIGWIDFGTNSVGSSLPCRITNTCVPSASINATSTTIASGGTTNINWTSQDTSVCSVATYEIPANGAQSILISPSTWTDLDGTALVGQPSASGLLDNTIGATGVDAILFNTTSATRQIQYMLTCAGGGITLFPATVTVSVLPSNQQATGTPSVNIYAGANTPGAVGSSSYSLPFSAPSFLLSFRATLPPVAGNNAITATCTLSADHIISDSGWNGSTIYGTPFVLTYNTPDQQILSTQQLPVSASNVSIGTPVTFTLGGCTDSSGDQIPDTTATVSKVIPIPQIVFNYIPGTFVVPAVLPSGLPGSVKLYWTSTNTRSCSATWAPSITTTNYNMTTDPQNPPALVLAPGVTTTFQLTCLSIDPNDFVPYPATPLHFSPNSPTTNPPNGNPAFEEF